MLISSRKYFILADSTQFVGFANATSRETLGVIFKDNRCSNLNGKIKTATEFGISQHLQTIRADIQQFVARTERRYDLIFADPPYAYKHYEEIAQLVFEHNLLNEGGLLVIEHGKQTSLETITQFDFSRNYGGVHFSFFRNVSEIERK